MLAEYANLIWPRQIQCGIYFVLHQTEELFLNIKLKVAFELCYHFSYIFNCFVLFEVYDKTKLSNAVMKNLNSIVIESRFQNHFLVDCMCTLNGRRNLRYLLTLMTNWKLLMNLFQTSILPRVHAETIRCHASAYDRRSIW